MTSIKVGSKVRILHTDFPAAHKVGDIHQIIESDEEGVYIDDACGYGLFYTTDEVETVDESHDGVDESHDGIVKFAVNGKELNFQLNVIDGELVVNVIDDDKFPWCVVGFNNIGDLLKFGGLCEDTLGFNLNNRDAIKTSKDRR